MRLFGWGKGESPASEDAERKFFGGKTMEEAQKKEEAETAELMPYGELMDKVGGQATKVKAELSKEKELAAEIRKMGGRITKETAKRIRGLDAQLNGLIKVYEKVLEPVRTEAGAAFIEDEEYLVPKPEELEALMVDPSMIELPDAAVTEIQESAELKAFEKALQDSADVTRQYMDTIKSQMERAYQDYHKLFIPTTGDKAAMESFWKLQAGEWKKLAGSLAEIEAQLADVRSNLGFVENREARAA